MGRRKEISDLRVRGIAEREPLGHGFHGQTEGGVSRYILHPFTADIHAAAIFQTLFVLIGSANSHFLPPAKFSDRLY
jgi:hypothetical protein